MYGNLYSSEEKVIGCFEECEVGLGPYLNDLKSSESTGTGVTIYATIFSMISSRDKLNERHRLENQSITIKSIKK